jgi:hypothetical protein
MISTSKRKEDDLKGSDSTEQQQQQQQTPQRLTPPYFIQSVAPRATELKTAVRTNQQTCRAQASQRLGRFLPPSIEIRSTFQKGCHVVATREILPGETLFVSVPYCAVVSSEYCTSVCQNCVKVVYPETPLECTTCGEIYYCSETCRAEDAWYHGDGSCGTECGFYVLLKKQKNIYDSLRFYDPDVITAVRLLARMIAVDILRKAGREPGGLVSREDYWLKGVTALEPNRVEMEDVLSLVSNRGCFDDERNQAFDNVRKLMCAMFRLEEMELKEPGRGILHQAAENEAQFGELVLDLICITASNAFNVTGPESLDIVVGLFPSVSLLNHSCQPNVEYTKLMLPFAETNLPEDENLSFPRQVISLRIRALRIIKCGDEICTSYIPLYMYPEHFNRKVKLLKNWCFECDCPSCSSNFILRFVHLFSSCLLAFPYLLLLLLSSDGEWKAFASKYFCKRQPGCFGLKIAEYHWSVSSSPLFLRFFFFFGFPPCPHALPFFSFFFFLLLYCSDENTIGLGTVTKLVCSHCGLTEFPGS